jgi:hypothetical protein
MAFSVFIGLLLAIVWLLPVYAEWHFSAASEPPLTRAYEKIGLLGNFEVAYTVLESPNHSPSLGRSVKRALRAFFPVLGADTISVSPQPRRIVLSLLLTALALAAFRRLALYSASEVEASR